MTTPWYFDEQYRPSAAMGQQWIKQEWDNQIASPEGKVSYCELLMIIFDAIDAGTQIPYPDPATTEMEHGLRRFKDDFENWALHHYPELEEEERLELIRKAKARSLQFCLRQIEELATNAVFDISFNYLIV